MADVYLRSRESYSPTDVLLSPSAVLVGTPSGGGGHGPLFGRPPRPPLTLEPLDLAMLRRQDDELALVLLGLI